MKFSGPLPAVTSWLFVETGACEGFHLALSWTLGRTNCRRRRGGAAFWQGGEHHRAPSRSVPGSCLSGLPPCCLTEWTWLSLYRISNVSEAKRKVRRLLPAEGPQLAHQSVGRPCWPMGLAGLGLWAGPLTCNHLVSYLPRALSLLSPDPRKQ